jgi:hypothetical protein
MHKQACSASDQRGTLRKPGVLLLLLLLSLSSRLNDSSAKHSLAAAGFGC